MTPAKPLWWMALSKISLSLKIGLVLNPTVEMMGTSLGFCYCCLFLSLSSCTFVNFQGECLRSFFLFFLLFSFFKKNLFIRVCECFIYVYACMPEEDIGSYYGWLLAEKQGL